MRSFAWVLAEYDGENKSQSRDTAHSKQYPFDRDVGVRQFPEPFFDTSGPVTFGDDHRSSYTRLKWTRRHAASLVPPAFGFIIANLCFNQGLRNSLMLPSCL